MKLLSADKTGSGLKDNVTYDRRTGQYRSADGRFLKRADVLRLVDKEALQLEVRMKGHARLLVQGKIDIPEFQKRAAEDLKLSAIRSTILGSGGRSQVTSQAYGSTGRLLREQYQFLGGFARDLADGKLSKAQAIQRASLYGASTRSAFHQAEKIARGREGFKLAKRILDAGAQHCNECLQFATGDRFVPIENIVPVGTRCSCRSRCRCSIIWKK